MCVLGGVPCRPCVYFGGQQTDAHKLLHFLGALQPPVHLSFLVYYLVTHSTTSRHVRYAALMLPNVCMWYIVLVLGFCWFSGGIP